MQDALEGKLFEDTKKKKLIYYNARGIGRKAMGWLRLVGSLKLQVSFAKEPYKKRRYSAKETYIIMQEVLEGKLSEAEFSHHSQYNTHTTTHALQHTQQHTLQLSDIRFFREIHALF